MTNENVQDISETFSDSWGGSIDKNSTAAWIDLAIAIVECTTIEK
jgi:hypothetical protein